jgi:hypothetical protein
MQLLDAYNNALSGNLFYGNQQTQLWLQQRSNNVNTNLGDVFGNSVTNNDFFPTNGNFSINHTTLMPSAAPMANYDLDRFSTLLSPTMASEGTSSGLVSYSFPSWQTAVGPNGPRLLDVNGHIAAPVAGRAVGTIGAGLIAPGNLQIGITGGVNGWGRGGNPAAPTLSNGNCPPGISACIRATEGTGSTGLMSSPKFATIANSFYRVSFDAAVSDMAQGISLVVRNATTNVTISPTLETPGSTGWKRYSFVFQITADSPNLGARIDFQKIQGNKWITVSNLELSPMTAAAGAVPYALIYNTSRTPSVTNCPVSDPVSCANFYSFATGTPVVFPTVLNPLQAMAVFATDPTLIDSDGDGIADVQDRCAKTPTGAVVNNEGCAQGQ